MKMKRIIFKYCFSLETTQHDLIWICGPFSAIFLANKIYYRLVRTTERLLSCSRLTICPRQNAFKQIFLLKGNVKMPRLDVICNSDLFTKLWRNCLQFYLHSIGSSRKFNLKLTLQIQLWANKIIFYEFMFIIVLKAVFRFPFFILTVSSQESMFWNPIEKFSFISYYILC